MGASLSVRDGRKKQRPVTPSRAVAQLLPRPRALVGAVLPA
jgi:hypothetical protein